MELEECKRNPMGLYEVGKNDTVSSVCRRFEVLPQEFARVNAVSAILSEGMVVIIPSDTVRIYTVCIGDTLESICRKFQLKEEEFKKINHCDYVYPTQRVCVGKK